MPAHQLTDEELRLLKGLARTDGVISWDDALRSSGLDERPFKGMVRGLMQSGLLLARDMRAARPRLGLSDAGAEEVRRRGAMAPTRRLSLSLRSAVSDDEALEVILSDEQEIRLARMAVGVASHRLSAIRYFLLWEPGAVSQALATRAAGEIGLSLLPTCQSCAARSDRGEAACKKCVRGQVSIALAELHTDEYLRLELSVDWPWTFVPWELAAVSVISFPVLDPRISMVRRHTRGSGRDVVLDGLHLLVASAATADAAEREKLSKEARQIEKTVRETETAMPVGVELLEQYASTSELADRIRQCKPNVVHLLGHGAPQGLVVSSAVAESAGIADALSQESVVIVVLASCFGSTAFGMGARAESLATKIVRLGTSAVVAFEGQAEASYTQAFALRFYRRLLEGASVEQGVMSGRQALLGGTYQWGQLVLSLP
jgi:hypothetical protein